MSKFSPTLEEVAKYRDYKVVFKESTRPKSVADADGTPILIFVTIYRVPKLKTFEVFIRSNASADERGNAVTWGAGLPRGNWAWQPDRWYRCKRSGNIAWWQSIGRPISDPLLELEIEEFRDSDIDLELGVLS